MANQKEEDWKRILSGDYGKPRHDFTCDKCGGNVTRWATNLVPRCEKCGEEYINAQDAPVRGVEEFLEGMKEPMTI